MNRGAIRRARHARPGQRGFSLLEVLVSILLVIVGLLGVSKMQAAAIANTQIARTRSLIAFQASSLAAAMHANRAFWATQTTAFTVALAPSGVAFGGPLEAAAVLDCTTAACPAPERARHDVQAWADQMKALFPDYLASIDCAVPADIGGGPHAPGAAANPPECLLTVRWGEAYIAVDRTTARSTTATQTQQYTQVVKP